jgi:hypothetical protein
MSAKPAANMEFQDRPAFVGADNGFVSHSIPA